MSTDIDWQHELDSSFGTGDDVAPGHYIAAGRTAARRRRRSTVAAGLLAAAVVAGVAWGVTPDGAPKGSETKLATTPDGSQETSVWDAWPDDEAPVRFAGNGFEIRDGAVVHERRDDLYPGKGTKSVALDVSHGGERWWVAMEWNGNEAIASNSRPEDSRFATFDAFVADRVRGGGMITSSSEDDVDFLGEPATLDADGLVLAPGAGPVLERVDNPMGYTEAQGQSLGIRVMFKGREKYSLVVRHADGGTSMGTNDASGDFAGWLEGRVASQRSLDVLNGVTDGPPGAPADPSRWLRLQGDGDVVGAKGVALLEVDADPDLADFALGADRTGAVRVLVDERPRFAAYRVIDGELEVIAAPGSFDSMSAFLEWARQQYASGEGMR